jgi:CPA2 family monovalent cation:H+ antiporter-2
MEGVLLQATIYLTAMVIAVPLSVRLGLGSVLGYLIAGIAIGPILGVVGSETQDLQHYAEFGVVLMLFLIGLELDPKTLWNMRQKLLGVGGAQIILSTAAIAAAANTIGLPLATALAVGITLALSSTAIVLTTLTEKGLMRTEGGRSSFSVLLTQDIAVIPRWRSCRFWRCRRRRRFPRTVRSSAARPMTATTPCRWSRACRPGASRSSRSARSSR